MHTTNQDILGTLFLTYDAIIFPLMAAPYAIGFIIQ